MRCTLRTVRNDAHPRTFRTLVDLDYSTPRLDCRDAPPLECSVRSDELPVSMRMHFCLLSRAANVRARAYAHGHVCVRARAIYRPNS